MSRYSWNTAKVGIQHQSIKSNQSIKMSCKISDLIVSLKNSGITLLLKIKIIISNLWQSRTNVKICLRGCRGHDNMVVGFITTYAISAYYHWHCEFESRTGEVYSIQYYVIKFVSDLRQFGDFLRVFQLFCGTQFHWWREPDYACGDWP